MKIVGVLSWFDESPTWLSSAIHSMAPAIDALVAVDGAYELFPGSMDEFVSSIEQVDAVTEACRLEGLELILHRPDKPFKGNEVEKRNLTLDLARTISTVGDDWFLVFDADCFALKIADDFRDRLEKDAAGFAVGQYGVLMKRDVQLMKDKYGVDDGKQSAPEPCRCLYRSLPNLRYEGLHWCLAADGDDGKKFYLWGHPGIHSPMATPYDATYLLLVEHRNVHRVTNRADKARVYYAVRDATKAEKIERTVVMEGVDGKYLPLPG